MDSSEEFIICNLSIYVERLERSFQFYVVSNNGLYCLKKGKISRKLNISAFLTYNPGLETRMENGSFEIGIRENGRFGRRDYNSLRLEGGLFSPLEKFKRKIYNS